MYCCETATTFTFLIKLIVRESFLSLIQLTLIIPSASGFLETKFRFFIDLFPGFYFAEENIFYCTIFYQSILIIKVCNERKRIICISSGTCNDLGITQVLNLIIRKLFTRNNHFYGIIHKIIYYIKLRFIYGFDFCTIIQMCKGKNFSFNEWLE